MSVVSGKSNILQPTDYDMQMMLACEVHQGSKNLEKQMEKYVHKRKQDGKKKKI